MHDGSQVHARETHGLKAYHLREGVDLIRGAASL